MREIRHIHILFIALLGISSCLEPFRFEIEEQDSTVVVDGQFTDSGGDQTLYLSRTNRFGLKTRVPIEKAEVLLIAGNGRMESYAEKEPGKYVLDGQTIQGEEGEIYSLRIELDDGSVIISAPESMPSPSFIDSISFKFDRREVESSTGSRRRQPVIEILAFLDIPTSTDHSPVYLKWTTDEWFVFNESVCGPLDPIKTCYVPVEASRQQISLFSGANSVSTGGRIEDQLIYSKTSFDRNEFRGQHYFITFQQTINRNAYEYWLNAQTLVNQTGTIFDVPPAPLRGNLSYMSKDEAVLGYFELASLDTAITFVYPHEYREEFDPIPPCSSLNNTFSGECCNCLQLLNASYDKPNWID